MIDRRDFLRRFLKGVAIAAVAPEVIARACEAAKIPDGKVFSFGNRIISSNTAADFFARDPERLYGAIAKALATEQPYISVLNSTGVQWQANLSTGQYRGIEFGLDRDPLRVFRPRDPEKLLPILYRNLRHRISVSA